MISFSEALHDKCEMQQEKNSFILQYVQFKQNDLPNVNSKQKFTHNL